MFRQPYKSSRSFPSKILGPTCNLHSVLTANYPYKWWVVEVFWKNSCKTLALKDRYLRHVIHRQNTVHWRDHWNNAFWGFLSCLCQELHHQSRVWSTSNQKVTLYPETRNQGSTTDYGRCSQNLPYYRTLWNKKLPFTLISQHIFQATNITIKGLRRCLIWSL